MAKYYLSLWYKIILYDSRIGYYICYEYNNFRSIDYPSYKLDFLTREDIRYIINYSGCVWFIQYPIGINK